MPRWVKRPVVIEAVRYLGLAEDDGEPEFDTFDEAYPRWLVAAFHKRTLYVNNDVLMVNTLEGQMVASRYDYVCRGVKGEIYPCKPDIFENNHLRQAA